MFKSKKTLAAAAVVMAFVALAVMGALAGCSSSSPESTLGGTTAIADLEVAQAAVEATAAPDAKLLVVQTATSVATTGTPVWAYTFGSPSTDLTYVVYTVKGSVMSWGEGGTAGLSADDWAQVPATKAWKIDSDDAYAAAFKAAGGTGTPAGYFMGMITYKSADETSTVNPFEWNVWIDPGDTGASANRILVDANSGKATVSDQ